MALFFACHLSLISEFVCWSDEEDDDEEEDIPVAVEIDPIDSNGAAAGTIQDHAKTNSYM